MALTNEQLHEIRQIIADHHNAFVINTMGPDAVNSGILETLREKGLVDVDVQSIADAYLYGQLLAASTDKKTAKMGYEQFKEYVRKNPVPLSETEKRAVQYAQHRAAQAVQGLSTRVERQVIREALAADISTRENVKQLGRELREASGDWERDWDMVAVTEKHGAMQTGVADSYRERYGDDVRVAVRPTPDACPHCNRIYVGPDGQPRVFKLSDLQPNTVNHGQKAANWVPVLPPMHPHCQCQLVRVAPGWGFDDAGSLVPGGELGIEYANPESFQKSLIREADLRKAFTLQGRIRYQGLDIAIENKAHTERHWTDDDGNKGTTTMLYAYGYIVGTEGADGDGVDVYVGPDPDAPIAYIIHQQNPKRGVYDEDKVMLGFSSEAHARSAYQAHYNRSDFYVGMVPMPIEQLKRWVGNTAPQAGEMMKSGKPLRAHVIPLQKSRELKTISGNVAPFYAAASSPAGDRNPGNGTVINQIANSPRTPAPKAEGVREWLDESKPDRDTKSQKKNREVYEFSSKRDRKPYTFVVPKGWGKVEPDEIESNREMVEKELVEKQAGNRNRVEVTDEDSTRERAQ